MNGPDEPIVEKKIIPLERRRAKLAWTAFTAVEARRMVESRCSPETCSPA